MLDANLKLAILLLTSFTIGDSLAGIDTDWWRHTTLYEIYISSFKDSNGDGLGDIKGITKKLDHFVDLNIETLYISPFFRSPMNDLGYDISDYTDIDPIFGNMEDFNELMRGVKSRGLKLIADLVINHSSDEHPWFQKSIDRIDPYTDYYLWVDPKGFDVEGNPIVPNNWISIFGGTAWQWNEKRRQFYLHQFAVKQPDFNLRSAELKKELKKILKFWLDKGVAGFRLDATKHFVEDELLRDEPLADPNNRVVKVYADLDHKYTTDLWESYEFIHELRDYIDQYSRQKSEEYEKIFVAEAYTNPNMTMAYYGTEDYGITHFPFNFGFVGLNSFLDASSFNKKILYWLKSMPKGATPNWVAENHDNFRVGSRLCEEYMDIVTITIMMLPGVACIYYGQEIGMTNNFVRIDQRKDPNNDGTGVTRDGERLPMQWDDTMNSGFTSRYKSWLPVHPNYWKTNVETQKAEKMSKYNIFKALSKIRRRKTMKWGDFKSYIVSEWVYAFVRSLNSYETYVTVLNLGSEIELIDLHDVISELPENLEVAVASVNAGYQSGDQIRSVPKFPKIFTMRPLSAIVLSTKTQARPANSNFGTELLDPRKSVAEI
ncbi:maltase 2-like [Planococcus citri]|uniref:maltase 2-like n=1 Tax=Planococcus citri TaxID=170843 RepID=UPI0031F7DB40